MELFPIDDFVDKPFAMMSVVPGTSTPTPVIWQTYERILRNHGHEPDKIEYMDRFAFYDRAKEAFAIVATGESAVYANILLKKGVIK